VADTTTTAAPETTTTGDDDTTTTVEDTTTTATPETTTTVPETATTAAPETTATTVADTTTTAAPETTTTTLPCEPFVYDMAWPLAGDAGIGSPFGADRDGGARRHLGNDIAAPKLTPVLAVADGVVARIIRDQGKAGSYAVIEHQDGWQSYYIHLNNDLYGTDDGLGIGVRPDLTVGTPVARGELIGWVGDSGNAEDTVPHLHFELRMPEGDAIDPRPSLVAAYAGTEIATTQPHWPYADDDGNPAEDAAALLLTQGVLLACDGSAVNFCPDVVAGPDVAATVADFFAHKSTPQLEGQQLRDPAIPACPPAEDCPMLVGLTEADVASVAVWIRIDALVSTLRPKLATEDTRDVMLPSPEDADTQLRVSGARDYCNPPLDQVQVLTRGEAVRLLAAWVAGKNPDPCPTRGT
jgi:murein DD-endopeptidase MepM/ murein hydrolase activator NlpD